MYCVALKNWIKTLNNRIILILWMNEAGQHWIKASAGNRWLYKGMFSEQVHTAKICYTDLKPATFECFSARSRYFTNRYLSLTMLDCSKVLVLLFFFSTLRKPLLWTVPSHSKVAFVCWIVYCVLTSYMLITKNSHPLPLCTENDCNFKHQTLQC